MCKERKTCTFLKLSNGSLQFNLHALHPCSLYTMLKKINRYFLEVNKEVFNNDAWTCNRFIIKLMQVLSVPVIFIPVFSKLTLGHMRFKSPFLLPKIQLEDYLLCGMFLGELDNALYKHFKTTDTALYLYSSQFYLSLQVESVVTVLHRYSQITLPLIQYIFVV